jgi:hypothetical protein
MRNFTFLFLLFLLPVVVSAQRRARVVKPATDTITAPPTSRSATSRTITKVEKENPSETPEEASPRSAKGKAAKTTPVKEVSSPGNVKVKAPKTTPTKEETVPRSVTKAQVPKTEPVVKKAPPKTANAILPKTTTIFHKLGDENISIKVMHYGENKEPFFINLHDDEITAVSGAKRILESDGGTLVRIENNGERNIRFKLDKKTYAFDPNRIFSKNGIIQTLNMFGKADIKAIEELEKFAARILQILPSTSSCIIALHNNSNGLFSIDSYFSGREREKDAKAVSARPNEDPDDLFLTTDSLLFIKLRKEKFNIVWQDNANAFRDGSLSIYCGEKNICYLNCETEHGRLSQYWEMISTAYKYVRKPGAVATVTSASETGSVVYSYQLTPSRDSSFLSGVYDIYFGDKKIGSTRLISEDGTSTTYGQLEVLRSFPLCDNMDLYYYKSRSTGHKIELRIDPTRQKTQLNPDKAVVLVKVIS